MEHVQDVFAWGRNWDIVNGSSYIDVGVVTDTETHIQKQINRIQLAVIASHMYN